ncbi:hypothetical protein [Streptomyces luteogriseus]|uniref:hypothetical protein n=1 Tax=Streptomyces luteogriseus TaxID=68233 RepID=UPI0036843D1F
MDPLLLGALVVVAVTAVVSAAAVLVTRLTMNGTRSEHRARVLSGAAEVIRAVRGRK